MDLEADSETPDIVRQTETALKRLRWQREIRNERLNTLWPGRYKNYDALLRREGHLRRLLASVAATAALLLMVSGAAVWLIVALAVGALVLSTLAVRPPDLPEAKHPLPLAFASRA